MHFKDFVDYYGVFPISEENSHRPLAKDAGDTDYTRFILHTRDAPASLVMDIEEYLYEPKLYCMYNGVKHKVIRGSNVGDVFITDNLESDSYTKRVSILDLYQFSKE